MKLIDASICGFRRFGGDSPHRIRLDSPIICLIGANEAGKSSVLDALTIGCSEDEIADGDLTRGEGIEDDQVITDLRFRLEPEDVDAVAHIRRKPSREDPTILIVQRTKSHIFFELDRAVERDLSDRRRIAESIEVAVEHPEWPLAHEPSGSDLSPIEIEATIEGMTVSEADYSEEFLAQLGRISLRLRGTELFTDLADQIDSLIEYESEAIDEQFGRALFELRPPVVRFTPAARLLSSEYDLETIDEVDDEAVFNLARAADLDLEELRQAIERDETGTVQDLIDDANEVLKKRFAAWTQHPPVSVLVDTDRTFLHVHVKSGTGTSMKIGERSDGLRMFVALVAKLVAASADKSPILLLDEIETHLHYNAQADLMEVIAQQRATSKVIYTTHSAACLPEDLGTCVRIVEGIGDKTASRIRNEFWSDEPGLGPLLMALGATGLSFVPIRPAAITEGASDLVLLPTIFREAAAIDQLGYQVIPGASNAAPTQIAGLDLSAPVSVWILDGDRGGEDRRKQLRKAGIPEERIELLKYRNRKADVEDLVSPATYVAALNSYIADSGGKPDVSLSSMPAAPFERHRFACQESKKRKIKVPSKVAMANCILRMRGSMPILDPKQAGFARQIHRRVSKSLLA